MEHSSSDIKFKYQNCWIHCWWRWSDCLIISQASSRIVKRFWNRDPSSGIIDWTTDKRPPNTSCGQRCFLLWILVHAEDKSLLTEPLPTEIIHKEIFCPLSSFGYTCISQICYFVAHRTSEEILRGQHLHTSECCTSCKVYFLRMT
jgi:hypothetical protein